MDLTPCWCSLTPGNCMYLYILLFAKRTPSVLRFGRLISDRIITAMLLKYKLPRNICNCNSQKKQLKNGLVIFTLIVNCCSNTKTKSSNILRAIRTPVWNGQEKKMNSLRTRRITYKSIVSVFKQCKCNNSHVRAIYLPFLRVGRCDDFRVYKYEIYQSPTGKRRDI